MIRRASFTSLFRRDTSHTRLDEIIEFAPASGAREEIVYWFGELLSWLRPEPGQDIVTRVRFLQTRLDQRPEVREQVSKTVTRLVEGTSLVAFLVSGGIPHDFHFGGALKEWFYARVLPSACKTDDGAEVLRMGLQPGDMRWLRRGHVAAFLASLVGPEAREKAERALCDAATDLTHQIVAQAHLPGVRALAQSERSPFRGLYDAVMALEKEPLSRSAHAAVHGRTRQCVASLRAHRAELSVRGADLTTTFLLARLEQQIERLDLLAGLLHDSATLPPALEELGCEVLRHASGHRLVARGTDLLTQNLIDTAADVGKSYIGDSGPSFRAAFTAGAGGGLLMALATMLKYGILGLHLPALYEGLAASLNYAAIFCAAYLLHFTIATKLPAHTAATLARSLQSGEGVRKRLAAFLSVWRALLRVQIAGLLGNVVVAGPVAFLGAFALKWLSGHQLLSSENAEHALQANSLIGPSVLFAALAGVFLWLSSLIGALADNWARSNRVSDRLATSRTLMKRVGLARARTYADGLVKRWGGLVGNASLGIMLGAIPALCAIARLPIEIRHITVSTSSVALAAATGDFTPLSLVMAILGLVAIAAANVTVSFVLALWFAMRGTRGAPDARAVIQIGLRRWVKSLSHAPLDERPQHALV